MIVIYLIARKSKNDETLVLVVLVETLKTLCMHALSHCQLSDGVPTFVVGSEATGWDDCESIVAAKDVGKGSPSCCYVDDEDDLARLDFEVRHRRGNFHHAPFL